MNYSIYIKYKNGSGSYLASRGRTAWKHRTAKKHLRDLIDEKLASDKWQDVNYFAIVTV